jgi:hypothetical protein
MIVEMPGYGHCLLGILQEGDFNCWIGQKKRVCCCTVSRDARSFNAQCSTNGFLLVAYNTERRKSCHVNRTPPDLMDQHPPTDRTGSPLPRAVRARTTGLKESGDYNVHLWMGAMHIYDSDPDSVATQPRVQEAYD